MKPVHNAINYIGPSRCLKLLEENNFGHLACHSTEDIYLVPISYVYEEGYLYSHSLPGKKIDMMEHDSRVCVQVEKIDNFYVWESVIAWGTFERLKGDHASSAMRTLVQNLNRGDSSIHASQLEVDFMAQLESSIVFRIKVERATGRTEGYEGALE